MGRAQDRRPRRRARTPQGKPTPQICATALEAAAAAILITNRNGTIVWANHAFEELSGYRKRELIGQSARLLKSGRQPTSFYEQMWEAILAGRRWQGELLNRGKGGRLYWEQMTITPVQGPRGAITHFVAVKQDITERRKAREQIHLLAQAVESASEMIGVADEAGNFVFVNQAFEQGHGYSAGEILGKRFSCVFSANNPAGLTSQLEANIAQHNRWKGECQITRRDGTDFLASLSLVPIRDETGRPVGTLGVGRDISRRKLMEERLSQSEEQFRQIGENIGGVLFILTPEPLATDYVNPAYEALWGRPRSDLYVRPGAWMESVHPEDRRRMQEVFGQTLQGVLTEAEFRLLRPDGSVRWVDARTFPVTDPSGRLRRIVGIVEDITRRKQAEVELAESDRNLNAALREAEQRAFDSAKLSELVDVLQSCQEIEEAYQVTESALKEILAVRSGALCITSASRNIVEAVREWGDAPASQKSFRPEDCWALRRGRVHPVSDPESPLRCAHLTRFPEGGALCIPLAAHGETLGILYLESPQPPPGERDAGKAPERLVRQAEAVAERVSLALANLRLREALRRQSIHDALTGLYNRRYMEESLDREVSRAERHGRPVSLLMLDIDNFKAFNDCFGHQAGDALLQAFGTFLNRSTRGQDVACRYGGEEFTVILAEASKEAALQRARQLQRELAQLSVEHAGQVLGKVTVSIGVAGFPEQGRTASDLLRAADKALYRAKSEGRDRVVIGMG